MFALISTAVCASACAAATLPVYTCNKVSTPPAMDGTLHDDAWTHAMPVTLVDSPTGEPATKLTKARMCYDDRNLYVGFECTASQITATMTRRDDPIYQEDVVEIFVAPACDMGQHFEIVVSPRNVVFDADIHMSQDGKSPGPGTSFAWTCEGLRTAVHISGAPSKDSKVCTGWTAELSIPFAALGRATPKAGERWRGNLFRIDRAPAPEEYQSWSPTLIKPASFHVPPRFGTIFFAE